MHHRLNILRKTLPIVAVCVLFPGLWVESYAQTLDKGAIVSEHPSDQNEDATVKAQAVKKAISRERERVRQRIEMIRMWGLISELNLDDTTAKAFFSILHGFRQKQFEFTVQINDLKLHLAEAASKSETPKEKLQQLIDQYISLLISRDRLASEELKQLSTILNPRQQCQYILFGDRFNRDLQVIIRQVISKDNSKDNQESSSPPPAKPAGSE
jgi:hypothetical protein